VAQGGNQGRVLVNHRVLYNTGNLSVITATISLSRMPLFHRVSVAPSSRVRCREEVKTHQPGSLYYRSTGISTIQTGQADEHKRSLVNKTQMPVDIGKSILCIGIKHLMPI
jgi:hypothetical protein